MSFKGIRGNDATFDLNEVFFLGVTQSLATLIHKGGEKKALSNWQPIILSNVIYICFAKTLQACNWWWWRSLATTNLPSSWYDSY
jgi:hypothetical protein